MKLQIIREMKNMGVHKALSAYVAEHRRIGDVGMVAKYRLSRDILGGPICLPESFDPRPRPIVRESRRVSRSTLLMHGNGQACAPVPSL